MTKNQVLAALPKLTKADLATVRAAVDHLLGPQQGATLTAPPLFNALAGLIGNRVTYQAFTTMGAYKHWAKNVTTVDEFITEHFPDTSKVLSAALLRFLMELIVDDLKGRKVPATLGSITVNLGRLPEIFESAFPGYLESGAAHLIVKAMVKR